jgi:hypothetical protein
MDMDTSQTSDYPNEEEIRASTSERPSISNRESMSENRDLLTGLKITKKMKRSSSSQKIDEYTPAGEDGHNALLTITENPDEGSCWSKIPKYFLMVFLGSLLFIFAIVEIVFSTKKFTGSLSLLGDGIHNLIDVITMVIAFWADYVFFFNF